MSELWQSVTYLSFFFLSVVDWANNNCLLLPKFITLVCVTGNCGTMLGWVVDKAASNRSCGLWGHRGETVPADNGVFCLASPSYFLCFILWKKKSFLRNKVKQVSIFFCSEFLQSSEVLQAIDPSSKPSEGKTQLCSCWIDTAVFGNQPTDFPFGCVLWSVPQEKNLIICVVA